MIFVLLTSCLTLAVPSCSCAPVAAGQDAKLDVLQWEELGPSPISGGNTGRVSAVAPSATDPDRLYVAGADGGVWRSDDAGANWTPLTDHMPTQAVGALAVDPTDDDVVYVGTGEANFANHSRYGLGLYKSTDGGATWEHLAKTVFGGRCFSRLLIDPTNSAVLYASITRAGGFPELAAAKGHPGATGDLGVFKSLDGGVNWTRLSGGLPNLSTTDLALDPSDPTILYAGVGRIFGHARNGVYKTTDAGLTWTKLGGGLPTSIFGRVSVALAPSQPGRVFALITDDATSTGLSAVTLGAYRSDDGGASWTVLPVGSIQATYGWYLSVISVNPTDASQVLMGGLNLVRSNDAGASWSTVTPPHVDLHALAWDAAGRLLAGDDGGLHRSTNAGNSWTSLNHGLGLVQLYAGLSSHPTQDETFFGGFQDNGTNKRSAPGKSWSSVFGGDGGWTQVDQVNPNRVFVEYQGTANLYLSTTGGGGFTWSGNGIDPLDRNCFLPPFLIQQGDSSRMLYATHRVYRSTDGGANWDAISIDLSGGAGAIRCLAQASSNPSIVYAATNDGRVLRSDNGGASFTTLLTGHPGWPRVTREITVHPRKPRRVYLAGAAFGVDQIRRSTDWGTTWKTRDGDLPDVPVNVIEIALLEEGEALFAGTDAGLFVSFDSGVHWGRYGSGLPHACVIDVAVDMARKRVVVATQGRGVWRAPLVRPIGPR